MAWILQKNYTYYGPLSEIMDNPGNTPLLNLMGASTHLKLPPPPKAPVRARQVEPYKRGLSDMFIVAGPVAVSDRFRQIVEDFEPGMHWFAPLIMERKNGEMFEGPYWLFHIQQDVDCLLTDNDPALFRDYGDYLDTDDRVKKNVRCRLTEPGRSISLSKPQIDGRHLWTAGLLGRTDVFCSEEFKKAVRAAKLTCINFDPQCSEVDRPWRAEEQMGPLLARHQAYIASGRTKVDYTL
jgi:hypothetical protein